MAIVPNIMDMIAGVNQRKRAGRVREAMGNYLADPEGTIQTILPDDPEAALKLEQQQRDRRLQDEERSRQLFDEGLAFFRGVPEEERGTVLEQLAPRLREGGMTDRGFTALSNAVQTGNLADRMDAKAWDAQVEREMSPYFIQAGQKRMVGGEEIARGDYKRETIQVPRADGGVDIILFDPNRNGGEFVTEDGSPASPQQVAAAQQAMATTSEELGNEFDSVFGTEPRNPPARIVRRDSGEGQRLGGRPIPVPDSRPIINEIFGGRARISQTKRDPNSALGRKNPGSWHNRTSAAVDMAAIPGMTFEQAKAQIEAAGYPLIEAIDEYKNPSPHATGGHWHFVLGQQGSGQRRSGGGQPQYDMVPAGNEQGGGVRVSPTRVSSAGANRPGRFVDVPARELPPDVIYAQRDTQTGALVNVQRAPRPVGGANAGRPSAAEIKDQRSEENKQAGRQRFGTLLGQLGVQYTKLRNIGGAIVDPSRGGGVNAQAWVNTTSVGRLLGRMTGSDAESIRQTIDNTRPLLINAIREATGMSARAMDSNTELQFYIQSATDTGKDLVSNLAAIGTLDSLYGDGNALRGLPTDLQAMVRERMGQMNNQVPVRTLPGNGSGASAAPRQGWGQARVVK